VVSGAGHWSLLQVTASRWLFRFVAYQILTPAANGRWGRFV